MPQKSPNLIGTGACSKVYKTNNGTAIKVFESDSKLQFMKELIILKNTQHSNIIHVIDFNFEKCKITFPVGNYTLGQTPLEHFNPNFNKLVLHQLFQAVDYLHRNNIWHLDIKPGNILVFPNDNIKLIDFSHSLYIFYPEFRNPSAHGTPAFAPPEHWLSRNDVDHKYDVWSIGATMVHVRGLQHMYDISTENSDDIKMTEELVFALPTKIKSITQDFEAAEADLYIKMLSENPERISTADALKHEYFEGAVPLQPPVQTYANIYTRHQYEKVWKGSLNIRQKQWTFMWLYDIVNKYYKSLNIRGNYFALFHTMVILEAFIRIRRDRGVHVIREELQLYAMSALNIISILINDGNSMSECKYFCGHAYSEPLFIKAHKDLLATLDYKVFVGVILEELSWGALTYDLFFKLWLADMSVINASITAADKMAVAQAYPDLTKLPAHLQPYITQFNEIIDNTADCDSGHYFKKHLAEHKKNALDTQKFMAALTAEREQALS